MNNAAQKVTRIDKDAWEIATELANEYGVSICHIISESVRYCAENAEFKEMDVVVKRLVLGSKVLEQEGKMNELKIREDGIYLNDQKLKGVQAIKTKSTVESHHATVYLKFIAKLI